MPSGAIAVQFKLDADLERLRIPARRPRGFKDGLWRHTCFEVFLATRSGAYREYNFSPSGEWAAYAFRFYRKRISTHPRRPKFRIDRRGLVTTIEARGRVKIGLCAVIEEKNGALSYWALRHPAGKPDFHRRSAFAMELA